MSSRAASIIPFLSPDLAARDRAAKAAEISLAVPYSLPSAVLSTYHDFSLKFIHVLSFNNN